MECQFLDGDVLLALDAPAAVASSHDVKCSLARESQLILRPDGGSLVAHCVDAGSNGEAVRRALGGRDLHLFLVLQMERCTFLTRQRQAVQLHLRLAGSLQDELAVITFPPQSQGEFVVFIQACDIHMGTLNGHRHAVLHHLFHLCLHAFVVDGDVLCMAHTAHHDEQYP